MPCVPKSGSHPISLLVLQPETGPLYNSVEMAYSLYPYQVDYFVKNQWAEPPVQMLHPLILQTLENSHYFSVVTAASNTKYDYILATQLMDLRQVFHRCGSFISLRMCAQLINNDTNEIIAVKQFCVTEKAPCCNPYGGVIAANRATSRLLAQLVPFVIHRIEVDQEA